MYLITDYLAGAVIAGLCNIGDALEKAGDHRWHEVARAASLIEAYRINRIPLEQFAKEARDLAQALTDIAEATPHSSANMILILHHGVTIMEGLRCGYAYLGTSAVDAMFPPVSAKHPMLEVCHV